MTVPLTDELNIRERIEQLFQGASSSGGDLESAVAGYEQAAPQLSSAIATLLPLAFELGPAYVRPWSAGENIGSGDDEILLQLERESTGTKFRCAMSYELVEAFVSASFGAPAPDAESAFDCRTSQFCSFFISNAALAMVRQLVSAINGSRAQGISFEKIVEPDPDVPDDLKQPGFVATWPLIMNEVRHALSVYVPATEFVSTATEAEEADEEATDTGVETAWSDKMQSSLALAEVELTAVMNRPDMPLVELSNLKVGDVVEFGDAKSAVVLLECEGETLFTGEVGQKDGHFAVHVVGEVNPSNGA